MILSPKLIDYLSGEGGEPEGVPHPLDMAA